MPQARRLIVGLSLLSLSFSLVGMGTDLPRLRVSLPAVMSSLPIAFADAWGLFDEHDVNVELVGLSDNEERTTALMAGAIDGMVCDVTMAVLLSSQCDIVITSASYPGEQSGSLAVLSPKSFRIDSLKALYASKTGSNRLATVYRSDLEYQTDELLEGMGYSINRGDLYSYWTDILQLALWFAGQGVPAAVLPEPYITYISRYPLLAGTTPLELVHLSDFEGMELLPSVLVFRRAVVEERSDLVVRFYGAYREAVDRVNALSREELIETGINAALSLFFPGVNPETIPAGVLDSFAIPRFLPPQRLSQDQFESVVAWVNRKGYAAAHPSYDAITTGRFLP